MTNPSQVKCPECNSGKCVNCTTQAIDEDDQLSACGCACGGGLDAWWPGP